MERLPTAKFPEPVLWLRAGTSQLHLFEGDETADLRAHVSFDVDDFDALYAKAKADGDPRRRARSARRSASTRPAGCSSTCATRPAT